VTITGSGQSTDVVPISNSFPGRLSGPVSVAPNPGPVNNQPAAGGTVSAQPDNAYEVQAVIDVLNPGDSVSLQAYVTCGP
jgi:hypothetical protein